MNKTTKDTKSLLFDQLSVIKSLLLLAIIYTMYFTKILLVPIFLACLLYFLTIPVVDFFKKKLYIPSYLGALIIILILFFIVGYGLYFVILETENLNINEYDVINTINKKISSYTALLRKPLEILTTVFQELGKHLNLSLKTPASFSSMIFSNVWVLLIEFFTMFIFLYFLLASKDLFLARIVKVLLPHLQKKEMDMKGTDIIGQIQRQIWHYLFIRTMTNIGVAIIASFIFVFFQLPNPILLGVMAGILEFIPFIGACISTFIILIVSMFAFENPWYILLPPLTFFVFISLEGNLFIPYILGKGMTLNSVAVLLSIFFFGLIWGVMGSFLAIPIVMAIKIFLDNIKKDNSFSQLLEEE